MVTHATIDTVSMVSLCRRPAVKVRGPKKVAVKLGLEIIDEAIRRESLIIYLDVAGGLSDEWAKSCGDEIIRQLVIAWSDLRGIVFCAPTGGIRPAALNRKLRTNNFVDAGDKLIVRIALCAIATHGLARFDVATNDGDFWDPNDAGRLGDPTAPVATLLASHSIHSELLKSFFELISP